MKRDIDQSNYSHRLRKSQHNYYKQEMKKTRVEQNIDRGIFLGFKFACESLQGRRVEESRNIEIFLQEKFN